MYTHLARNVRAFAASVARFSTDVSTEFAMGLTRLPALPGTFHAGPTMADLHTLVLATRQVFAARHAAGDVRYMTGNVESCLEKKEEKMEKRGE